MLSKILAKFKSIFLYPFVFGYFGRTSRIDKPLRIDGKRNIFIGNNTLIQKRVWLGSLPLCSNNSQLIIKNNVRLGHYNHIFSVGSIVIEDNVLTADRVYISDNLHSYENVTVPIMSQPIKQLKNIVIGKNSWIGENVCIIGASIGKHCVIGANSVVTHDIPDYSVAVGAPAVVIKYYSFENKMWVKK